ncbi:MAG TPA: hypothetical protein P5013_07875 [Methanoregula sp.]|nr:hypothetical protein [Methanoregula sp.]
MRVKTGIILILGLLFLAGTAGAVTTVTVTGNSSWLVAGSGSSTTYEIVVTNSSGSVNGAAITFNVDAPYGKMSPESVTTDGAGRAFSTFIVNTKSGTAPVFASLSNTGETYPVNTTIFQKIDHANAYFAGFSHPLSGTVASQVPFTVSVTDKYGNPVDNRTGVNHPISLHITGPAPNDCGFVEAGLAHDISTVLDASGQSLLTVRLTTRVGDNNILMDAYQSIPNQLAWITAESKGIPFSMTQVVSPSGSPPTLPADNVSVFSIVYTLYDVYGNPTNNQTIWVNTTVPGEEKQFVSNSLGRVVYPYGPRSSIGYIDITATSVANATAVTTPLMPLTVRFKHTGAEIVYLTANPDTMPSADKNPSFTSNIYATVADHMGNAVDGVTVNFVLSNITYDGTYNVTSAPVLLTNSSVTNADGVATVQLSPGGFTAPNTPGFVADATGHAKVTATWNTSQKIVPVHWKNYPYLSVTTSVNPLIVQVNDTIDVTVGFKGDGWAMQPTPIDVVLTTDRSGSMMYDNPDRMVEIMGAAGVFVDQMGTNDQIGVVSFGQKGTATAYTYMTGLGPGIDSVTSDDNSYRTLHYPASPTNYAEYATLDLPLNFDKSLVKAKVNSMVPYSGTPMRSAIYKSINEINLHKGLNTVKGIVLLSDGDYNWYGDPLARGSAGSSTPSDYSDLTTSYYSYSGLGSGKFSEQNMSVYAKNNGIRIFSIAFGDDISAGGKKTLETLAKGSNGTYYEASATDIANVYKKIAGELKDTAGVNTTMTVDFENINVSGVSVPGAQVYDYVYNSTASTKIHWQNGTITVADQTSDWASDNKLDFNVGTIKVGESWNATFRLKVKESGLIDVFGKNSKVTFNGGTETLYLPQTFISVVPALSTLDVTTKSIQLKNLTMTETGEIKTLIPVKWDTTYDGNQTLTERVYYQINGGPWVLFDTKVHTGTPYDGTDYAQLDITTLPPGGYLIKIVATAADATDAVIILPDSVYVGGQGRTFIQLS